MIEKSAGCIIYQRNKDKYKYVLIKSTEGIWGFPKGHIEDGESIVEAALREVKEEIGLSVFTSSGMVFMDSYPLPKKENTIKENTYFLATASDFNIKIQESEILEARICDYEEAINLFQFDGIKDILWRVNNFLTDSAPYRLIDKKKENGSFIYFPRDRFLDDVTKKSLQDVFSKLYFFEEKEEIEDYKKRHSIPKKLEDKRFSCECGCICNKYQEKCTFCNKIIDWFKIKEEA